MSFDSCNESIEVYKDYTYIMYILCDKTSAFYSKIKNVVNIPIVICSTALSILNTTTIDDDIVFRYISIAFNMLIALSVAIVNLFKITEKEYAFKNHAQNFLQLNNKLNIEIAKNKSTMTKINILPFIDEYNYISEQISFHIPSRIRKLVIKHYKNYNLPLLLINNNKVVKTTQMAKYFKIFIQNRKQAKPNKHAHDTQVTDISTSSTSSTRPSITSNSNDTFRVSISDDEEYKHPYYKSHLFHQSLSPIESLQSEISYNSSPFSAASAASAASRTSSPSIYSMQPIQTMYKSDASGNGKIPPFKQMSVSPLQAAIAKKQLNKKIFSKTFICNEYTAYSSNLRIPRRRYSLDQ